MFAEKFGDAGPSAPEDASQEAADPSGWDQTLEDWYKSGENVSSRSPMGWRFQRWLESNKDKWEEYSKLGYKAKQQRRNEWALEEWGDYQKRRYRVETTRESELKKGVMLNYDAILQAEGGKDSPAAVEGTNNICKAAIAKGAGHCAINPDSKRMEFRYIKRPFELEHRREWRIEERQDHQENAMKRRLVGDGPLPQPISDVRVGAQSSAVVATTVAAAPMNVDGKPASVPASAPPTPSILATPQTGKGSQHADETPPKDSKGGKKNRSKGGDGKGKGASKSSKGKSQSKGTGTGTEGGSKKTPRKGLTDSKSLDKQSNETAQQYQQSTMLARKLAFIFPSILKIRHRRFKFRLLAGVPTLYEQLGGNAQILISSGPAELRPALPSYFVDFLLSSVYKKICLHRARCRQLIAQIRNSERWAWIPKAQVDAVQAKLQTIEDTAAKDEYFMSVLTEGLAGAKSNVAEDDMCTFYNRVQTHKAGTDRSQARRESPDASLTLNGAPHSLHTASKPPRASSRTLAPQTFAPQTFPRGTWHRLGQWRLAR